MTTLTDAAATPSDPVTPASDPDISTPALPDATPTSDAYATADLPDATLTPDTDATAELVLPISDPLALQTGGVPGLAAQPARPFVRPAVVTMTAHLRNTPRRRTL